MLSRCCEFKRDPQRQKKQPGCQNKQWKQWKFRELLKETRNSITRPVKTLKMETNVEKEGTLSKRSLNSEGRSNFELPS